MRTNCPRRSGKSAGRRREPQPASRLSSLRAAGRLFMRRPSWSLRSAADGGTMSSTARRAGGWPLRCIVYGTFTDGVLSSAPRRTAIASSSRPSRVRSRNLRQCRPSSVRSCEPWFLCPVKIRYSESAARPSDGLVDGVSQFFGQSKPNGQRMRSLSAAFTAGLA